MEATQNGEVQSAEPPKTENVEKRLNVHERLAQVKSIVSFIQKEQQKVNGQFFPVSANAVIAKVRPALEKCGLNFVTSVVSYETIPVQTKNSTGFRTTVKLSCLVLCVDDQKDGIDFEILGCGFDSLDKDVSKAITSGQKNGLLKLLLLETGEDEESKYSPDIDPPEPDSPKLNTISAEKVKILQALITECSLSQGAILNAAGMSADKSLDDMTEDKFADIHTRLKKRAADLKAKANATL